MKDPAVLFYFQDFLVGTEFMTDEEVGKYIRILCHQADKGPLSKKQIICICKSEIPDIINDKLSIDGNGNYYQKRMQLEREKRLQYTESRRKNRQKRNDKICKTYVKHMENENENINEDVIKDLYNSVVIFFDEDCRPKDELQKRKWYDTLEKLVRIDGYLPEHIQNIVKRTRMDDFWRTNFLSVLKLRKTNKEGIMYFTVFEKKINNATKKNGGADPIELAELTAKKIGIQ